MNLLFGKALFSRFERGHRFKCNMIVTETYNLQTCIPGAVVNIIPHGNAKTTAAYGGEVLSARIVQPEEACASFLEAYTPEAIRESEILELRIKIL